MIFDCPHYSELRPSAGKAQKRHHRAGLTSAAGAQTLGDPVPPGMAAPRARARRAAFGSADRCPVWGRPRRSAGKARGGQGWADQRSRGPDPGRPCAAGGGGARARARRAAFGAGGELCCWGAGLANVPLHQRGRQLHLLHRLHARQQLSHALPPAAVPHRQRHQCAGTCTSGTETGGLPFKKKRCPS